MKHLLLLAAACVALAVQAAPEIPGLLPTPLARPLLDAHPAVAAARSGVMVARLEADILGRSPYEWTARVSGQRRSLAMGPVHDEWNAGIEKPWRLPGKASADGALASATVAEAEAHYREALHAAARELATLWLEALAADKAHELAGAILAAAQENVDAVDKRVRAGDASKLDLKLAQGELAEQRRAANESDMQATVARARLRARFPGVRVHPAALDAPSALPQPASYYRERILEQSDERRLAEARLEKALARAERARAERVPDPTVGLYAASEAGGQERVVGITISIPLPGAPRSLRADQAVHMANAARHEVALSRLRLDAEIATAVATAEGSYAGAQIAEAGAATMQESAKLMQRAYSLGEADLQSLLSARRQAAQAAQHALAARVAALKAHGLLLIDGHLIWDLDKD